jgi:hypothetical protein
LSGASRKGLNFFIPFDQNLIFSDHLRSKVAHKYLLRFSITPPLNHIFKQWIFVICLQAHDRIGINWLIQFFHNIFLLNKGKRSGLHFDKYCSIQNLFSIFSNMNFFYLHFDQMKSQFGQESLKTLSLC